MQNKLIQAIAMVSLAGAFLSFSQVPAQLAPPDSPVTPLSQIAGDYKVGEGDTLEFKFFYNPELNSSAQVRPDGKLSFDLIGELPMAGMTLPQIRTEIESRYAPILNKPSVNVVVRTFASQKIFVGGEVNRPASIPLVGALTAYDAILEAGGPKRTGSLSRVILIRRGQNGTPVLRTVNLKVKMTAGLPTITEPIGLLPFDVLIVPETKIAKIDRVVDEYVRQVIPITLSGGFSYLFSPLQLGAR